MRNVQIRLLGGKAGAAAVLGSFPLCATMLYITSLGSAIIVMATKDKFCFFSAKPKYMSNAMNLHNSNWSGLVL